MKRTLSKIALSLILVVLSSCKKGTVNDASKGFSIMGFTFFNDRLKIDSLLISNFNDDNLKIFYSKYDNQTVWIDKSQRNFILKELQLSENEGLEPKDYHVDDLTLFENNFDTLSDQHIINYDLMLTQNVQKYISNISVGKLNPKNIYKDWDLKKKAIDVPKILFGCFDKNNFSVEINNCKPKHIIYQKLKTSLQLLKRFPEDTIGIIVLKEKIIFNKKNKFVIRLKRKLLFWGDLQSQDTIFSSVYDRNTFDAVKRFQARHGLLTDGIIGLSTIDALNYTKNQRIIQVIANLERWKWFVHDFENQYLLINIPDYNLVAVKNNDTIQTQKVVVGKDSRKTPILESKISNINLNPNWTVPPTILKEDIFPEAEKNKDIFRKKGLLILDANKKEIAPSIWKKEDAYKYKYVQKPSYHNSLGVMKINFPNRFSVYLHDTNHRNYFDFSYRSLSSGCVRLEKPLEMAAYLINNPKKWDLQTLKDTTTISYHKRIAFKKEAERIYNLAKRNIVITPEEALKRKEYITKLINNLQLKTIVVPIKDTIFIHQLYWTAWETKNKLQFREDIYYLDADLYYRLRGLKSVKKKP